MRESLALYEFLLIAVASGEKKSNPVASRKLPDRIKVMDLNAFSSDLDLVYGDEEDGEEWPALLVLPDKYTERFRCCYFWKSKAKRKREEAMVKSATERVLW